VAEESRSILGVADFDRRLRRAVESASGSDWVQGEVTALRPAASGHVYFTLKDEREDAVIDCVMYRYPAQRARRVLADGALIQVLGKATFWAPRGRLQLVVEQAQAAGRGAQLEALERLKAKLMAEGLFSRERKRPLPKNPEFIGVVTSGHGAAWHDIRSVAQRRSPVRLLLCPAQVQGEGAAESLGRALELLGRVKGLDAIIIGRGGGSAEDLMAFNDERLVRQLALCPVPVVSAVGHEIDTSLCDLVADARAATPSEAAELLVPDRASEHRRLLGVVTALRHSITARVDDDRSVLKALRLKLSDPRFVIAEKQQLLDEYRLRAERVIRRDIRRSSAQVSRQAQSLAGHHPRAVVARSKLRVAPLTAALNHTVRMRLARENSRLSAHQTRLQGLSPVSILARGYAIVLDADGRALRKASDTQEGATLLVRLGVGQLVTRVEEVKHESREQDD
jgi:exodeoxyribonuclease VII large subunit